VYTDSSGTHVHTSLPHFLISLSLPSTWSDPCTTSRTLGAADNRCPMNLNNSYIRGTTENQEDENDEIE
jgi:hypothetical protein